MPEQRACAHPPGCTFCNWCGFVDAPRLLAANARLRDFARSHYRYGREVREGRRFFTKTCAVCASKWDIDSEQEPLGGGPAPHAADCPMMGDD